MAVSTIAIPSKRQIQTVGANVMELFPSADQPLAKPPRGSSLKPVMGNYGFPFLGHMMAALVDPLSFAREQYERYGPVSWAGGVGFKVVAALGPEAMEEVWLNKDKAFSSTRGWQPMIGPFFHRGIMLLDFEEHRDHRRIMQQAFTRSRLDGYLQMMNPLIDSTLSGWQPRQHFPFYPSAKHLLLDLAAQVFVGVELGPESDQLTRDFNDTVRGGQAAIRANVPGGVWARGLQARKRLERFFFDLLPARKHGCGTDLFSVLAQSETDDGLRFSDADIVNHMIFMLMAAHDTSAIALSMLTYELGRNTMWQDRLRAEVLSNPVAVGSYGAVDELPLLDQAFKEILRMYAPAGTLFRQAIKDTEILGHYVPRKSQIALSVYASMRLPDYWPDPDTFDPSRFEDPANRDAVHRYAFSPFGGGVHKCIGQYFAGMTVKTILHGMLRRFSWTVPAGYRVPLTWGTGPTPADDLPIALERVQQSFT